MSEQTELTEFQKIIDKKRKREKLKEQEKIISELIKEIENKNRMLEAYENMPKLPPQKIIEKKYKHKDEGTVLALLSDIHAEHKITRQQTNGINEYNLEICQRRLDKFAINLIKLTEKKRDIINLDTLILALLGDFIHGFIHEEYQSTNLLTPIEAMMFITTELSKVINFILEKGKFKRIVAVCKVGNHSRTTDRVYSSNEAKVSYEWAIYHELARRYPEIEWVIEEGYFTYYKIYDLTARFHHGHEIKYQGGIGGLYVPLLRYVTRVNKQQRADFDCIGHFHSMDFLRNAGILINGSVCGFDTYAQRKGFAPEPPQQTFQIIDSKRGLTTNEPILLE